MKKLVLVSALVLSACAFAREANLKFEGRNPPSTVMRDWTPLSISIVTPVALPPGFWDVKGLEVGGFNWTENMKGLQIGFFNVVDNLSGLQVGGVNVARQAYGMQIGFVNVIEDKDIPFFPIINFCF